VKRWEPSSRESLSVNGLLAPAVLLRSPALRLGSSLWGGQGAPLGPEVTW
jgi:hypothetical protein